MTTKYKQRARQADLAGNVARAIREQSDAAVIFHATLARLADLNPTDHKTMSVLERSGPMSAGEIAKRTGLATASVTDLVDRLERKGFVRRIDDPEDRRRVLVEPIAERIEETRKRLSSLHRELSGVCAKYSSGELAAIADFLTRIAGTLRAETAKLEADRARSKEDSDE